MPTTRLLPGEKRRGPEHQPSVDEAMTGRSVRSIRQRFESDAHAGPAPTSASAPSTPAKKRSARSKPLAQTRTQAELAAFLKAGKDRASNSSTASTPSAATVPPRRAAPLPAHPSAAANPSTVGSLIEKWSTASAPRASVDRPPLQERHVQRADDHDTPSGYLPHHAHAMDSVDTFGSSSVDLDRVIPKTDPGRLESYAAKARHLLHPLAPAAAALQPASGDQSLKEIVTRGINRQTRNEPSPSLATVDDGRAPLDRAPLCGSDTQQQVVHLNREFKIQERIELFVQQSESHGRMSSARPVQPHDSRTPRPTALMSRPRAHSPGASNTGLDSSIPFELPPEDEHPSGNTTVIVHQVTHHTETDVPPDEHAVSDWGAGDVYIRELFSEAEETAERAVQCDENEDYFSAFELYWTVVDLYSKVIPFLTPAEGVDVHERIKMYTRRCEAIREAFEEDAEDDDVPQPDDSTQPTAVERNVQPLVIDSDDGSPLIQTFANAINLNPSDLSTPSLSNFPNNPRDTSPEKMEKRSPSSDTQKERTTRPIVSEAVGTEHLEGSTRHQNGSVGRKKSHQTGSKPDSHGELKRTPFPDHSVERPLASVPDAADPRSRTFITGATISASTQAHRDSLSRPISRSAARKSTNSITRQKVAEMQERVNLMQECLNNFTVKQKHLGPARALELAVTTLNANTFGDLKKLEPLAPNLEHKWSTELEVLLSMLKEIKVVQPGKGLALRDDIAKHLPALEKCDRSVRLTMRSFAALYGHVHYVDRETAAALTHGGRGQRRWWVKVPVVEDGGLTEDVLKVVQEAEMEMRSVFKICHEINVEIVKEIPIPRSFVDSLPRHARSLIPRDLKEGLTTWGMFKVSDYMKDKNIWNKDSAKEIVSSLEKVSLIWEARTTPNKSFFSRTFDIRGERFHQAMTAFRRCQTAIRDLRRDWYVRHFRVVKQTSAVPSSNFEWW